MLKKLTLWALRRLIRSKTGICLTVGILIEEYRRRYPEDNDMTALVYLTKQLQDKLGFE